ncbi:hypothetical protein HDA32_005116 [Spinactinospora alkalitolerans]|uniref:Phosphoadenosine phosphosulphate reductase domain-containing protein n=1 Tax=Spinactinospora alkalitolerans TaxID=687207 RepID=A0A852TZJ7_9ACTN|nr:hypothetical protein [Spinactinospora alkalitolerans]NYE49996.1 hypothetical protein [Spinactinospora alkalitolerans]
MSPDRLRPHRGQPRLRLLHLDAGIGSSALLLLAAQGAIPGFDYAVFPDPGWYPAAVYTHVRRLKRIAADAGIRLIHTPAGHPTAAHHCRAPALPLHSRDADGTLARLPNGCARSRPRAVESEAERLLGNLAADATPEGADAECAVGLGVDHAAHATRSEAERLRFTYPLLDIGWTRRDCRAFLFLRGLADVFDPLCIACPNRSDSSWAELKATDPAAWEQAVAVDAAIRHGYAAAAARGMPSGSTYYLHHDRVPLAEADLDADTGPDPDQGSPWACRDDQADNGTRGGDAT